MIRFSVLAFGVSGIEPIAGLRLIPNVRSSMTSWLQQQALFCPREGFVCRWPRLLSYPQQFDPARAAGRQAGAGTDSLLD